MTEKQFFDLIIKMYSEKTGDDLQADKLGYYLDSFLGNYPSDRMKNKLLKKMAARIIHEFMKNILDLRDLDWGDAAKLKDIYECRVCANAIAQTYIRGIIPPLASDIFGGNEVLSEGECDKILLNLGELMKKSLPSG